MTNDPLNAILYYTQMFSPLSVVFASIVGLVIGMRITRWYAAAGAWIVAGSGVFLALILMNYLISLFPLEVYPPSLSPRSGIDARMIINLILLASSFGFAAGLLCLLRGVWLLAKRCRELQHEN
jgi:hypothetical protein